MRNENVSEYTLAAAVFTVVAGVAILVSAFVPSWSPSLLLRDLVDPLWECLLGLTLVVGGGALTIGILCRHKMASDRWSWEVAGGVSMTAGWGVYAAVSSIIAETFSISLGVAFVFALASAFRVARVLREARRTRAGAGQARRDLGRE